MNATKAGGLCLLHGAPIIIIDTEAPLLDQNYALAAALGELDLEAVFIAPAARNAILRARTRGRLAAVASSTAGDGAAEASGPPTDAQPATLVHPHKPGIRDCD